MHLRRLVAGGILLATAITAAAIGLRFDALGERPLRVLPPGAFDAIDIERDGVRTTIRRRAGGFEVTAPLPYPADEPAARAAFDLLERLELAGRVGTSELRRVRRAGGVRLVARQGTRNLVDLFIAGPTGGESLARMGAGDGIWKVRGVARELLDRRPADWRDHQVTSFAAADAQRIEVETWDGARVALARNRDGDPDRWRVVRSSVHIGEVDDRVPRELVTTLSWLEASDFADAVTPAGAGLEPPSLTVGVALAGGATVTLLVGHPTGPDGDTFVKTPESSQIFVVRRYVIDRVNRRPVQFRDKTLCDISDGDVVSFGVTRGAQSYEVVRHGAAWRATRPAGLRVDPEKVAPLAMVFRRWSAPRIAEDPPSDAVSAPRAVIVGQSKKATCTIRVGREVNDAPGYFIQTPASRDVYIVPKWMIDRIAVRLDEISKA